jgi:hypothetical protein
LSPLREVRIFVFNYSYPLPPKGGTIEYQQVKKSTLGDSGVKILFGVDSNIVNMYYAIFAKTIASFVVNGFDFFVSFGTFYLISLYRINIHL